MDSLKKVKAIEVNPFKNIRELIDDMGRTGFQGRNLAKACHIFQSMLMDKEITIMLGYSGSLSTTGQWKLIQWLIENELVDIIVTTGANISEDILEAMGYHYYQCSINDDDNELFQKGLNRYYDVCGKEEEYFKMTELIAEFIMTLDSDHNYSSREFLYKFGIWLDSKNINSLVTSAAKKGVPIFCPALIDSPYGDAALLAKAKGSNLVIDSVKDYVEFMSLSENIQETGVLYLGGGVPKDFIQLFAVTPPLLYPDFKVPRRKSGILRSETNEINYPHKYAIQITTDSPQWGGLSGCTFEEATSWGKETIHNNNVQCFCDATIALPILIQYLSESVNKNHRASNQMNKHFK